MRDQETESLWDHITGECFEGPLAGRRLDFWPVHLTNVAAELVAHPGTILLKSDYRSPITAIMKIVGKRLNFGSEGTVLAPHFRRSMSREIDPRLPEGEQGLGVIDEQDRGKFYPVNTIPLGGVVTDEWLGRSLRIERSALDGVPTAVWVDSGDRPMQLLSRWYGFAFTFPDCEIYQPEKEKRVTP